MASTVMTSDTTLTRFVLSQYSIKNKTRWKHEHSAVMLVLTIVRS